MHTRISYIDSRHNSPQSSRSARPSAPPPPPPAPLPPPRSIISEDGHLDAAAATGYARDKPPPPGGPFARDSYSHKPVFVRTAAARSLHAHKIALPALRTSHRNSRRYFSRQAFKYTGEVCRDTTSTQWKQAPRGLISATGSTRRNNGKPERRPPSRMSHPHLSRRRRPYRATSSVMPPPSDRPCLPVKPLPTVKLLHTSPSSHASPRRLLSPRETRGENARPSPRRLVRPSLSHA